MQLHRLTDMTLDDPALGLYTTRKAAEEAIVEHALAGRIRGAVEFDVVEVEGDPVVIVLTDDDGRLAAGPFDSWDNAGDYSPHEELITAEWTVERYAQAVADQRVERGVRVTDLLARLIAEPGTTPAVRDAARALDTALTPFASFSVDWSLVQVGDPDPTADVDQNKPTCRRKWWGTAAPYGCTRVPHSDPHHVAGGGGKIIAIEVDA